MKLDNNGYKLIQSFEGVKLKSYLDSASIWTIGVGNTKYIDGRKVGANEQITKDHADNLFKHYADAFARDVDFYVKSNVNQNQFNALVSFAYNVGITAFKGSTLLKRVNINPNDVSINKEFLRWNRAGGRVVNGLTNRRIKESSLYFSR